MKITPEPTPRNVLYPRIVAAAVTAAAALASCQQEQGQALGGDVPFIQPDTPSTGQNTAKPPVKTKTGTPREPKRTIGRQRLGGAFKRVSE